MGLCLEMLCNVLSADYLNFSLFKLYGDKSLEQALSEDGVMTFDEAFAFTRQMLLSLEILHKNNLVHLDIKVLCATPAPLPSPPHPPPRIRGPFGLSSAHHHASRAPRHSPSAS